MVKIDLPDISKKFENFLKDSKKSELSFKDNIEKLNLNLSTTESKVDKNYTQYTDEHNLMESEIANLQLNFKDCNQSIETLTNRLQSNYEDLTRFMNKGFKGGGMNSTNSGTVNNQEMEEEL